MTSLAVKKKLEALTQFPHHHSTPLPPVLVKLSIKLSGHYWKSDLLLKWNLTVSRSKWKWAQMFNVWFVFPQFNRHHLRLTTHSNQIFIYNSFLHVSSSFFPLAFNCNASPAAFSSSSQHFSCTVFQPLSSSACSSIYTPLLPHVHPAISAVLPFHLKPHLQQSGISTLLPFLPLKNLILDNLLPALRSPLSPLLLLHQCSAFPAPCYKYNINIPDILLPFLLQLHFLFRPHLHFCIRFIIIIHFLGIG